jgi:polysaccharide biosynthesis protein PslF
MRSSPVEHRSGTLPRSHPPGRIAGATTPTVAWVSTFPPTACGLATYTSSLLDGVAAHRGTAERLSVLSLVDTPAGGAPADPMIQKHYRGVASSLRTAAAFLNTHDVVSIQHEYGIYAGEDGAEATELIDALDAPTVVTFHTVLEAPTPRQHAILRHLAARASRAVVMSLTAARRLTSIYGVPADAIAIVPHGFDARLANLATERDRPGAVPPTKRPIALTWGLLSPGKGLEVAIEAMALLRDLDPLPRYLITGATHPGVVATSGEHYRHTLIDLVRDLDLTGIVEFDDRYLDAHTLHQQIVAADVIVLPYLSTDQVTSGVLTEAIGAGRPVVATRFPHAVDVLSSGAGVVVQQGDAPAMAAALRTVFTDPTAAAAMGAAARRLARNWTWPSVGGQFDAVLHAVARRPQAATTLRREGRWSRA